MSRVYISSDFHIGHKNIHNFRRPEHCGFPVKFENEAQHREWLFDWVNDNVKKRDILMLLGDIAFTDEALDAVGRLPGRKVIVKGNHDVQSRSFGEVYEKEHGALRYKHTWLTHIPIHPQELRGQVNFHGHCVSEDTEILTKTGWKTYADIALGEDIYSFNTSSGLLEDDTVKDIVINEAYTGGVFEVTSKGLNMKVTDQHRVLLSTTCRLNIYETAEVAFARNNITLPRAGRYPTLGVQLTDDMLRLYVQLAADGNVTPSNLCRINIHKQRKKTNIEGILVRLGIDYKVKTYTNSDRTGFNFRLPEALYDWNIKGLDDKLLEANMRQVGIIKDEYSKSDGNRNLIFTSKKCEVDLLQHLFTINGFICKTHVRYGHGYSKEASYQLSVTEGTSRMVSNVKAKAKYSKGAGELFWCVRTDNTNFIARYKGSVFITGNCHNHTVPDLTNYQNCCVEELVKICNAPCIGWQELLEWRSNKLKDGTDVT